MRFFQWLTNNWGLKFVSLLFAAVIWFLVTNINDPFVRMRFYNVPVTLRNTSVITEAGQVYEVQDGSDVIGTVSFFARRAVSDQITRDNIVAVADVEKMTDGNTIEIELSVNKNSADVNNLTASNDTVFLNIEERKTRTLALSATTSGVLADGYIVGGVTSDQNLIRISGPASKVDMVDAAYADVDVTGFTSNIGTQADIRLFDSDGNQISDDSITRNITSVRVAVTILQTREVAMRFVPHGEVAEGFTLTGEVTSDPEVLTVAGAASVLSNLETIEIEADALDVTGRSTDLITTIDVSRYLPTGVSLADSEFDGQVSVHIDIDAE